MFLPDGERARDINSTMVKHLIASLKTIQDMLLRGGHGDAAVPDVDFERELEFSALDPVVHAHHYRAMVAVRGGRWADCRAALDDLRSDIGPARPFHCLRWGSRDLNRDKRDALLRCVNSDPQARIAFRDVDAKDFVHLERLTAEALDLLGRAAPDLVGELTELVRDLVFANGDPEHGFAFDGITSFHCWGALFLNAAEHRDLISLVDGLSHEGAHSYLFGLAAGAPFLLNGLGGRFSSPLRSDPRPLEGIYHATFVSARMHYAQGRLLASGLLSPEHADAADDARDNARQAFYAGLQTLDAHAEFTPLGRRLMDDTVAHMRAEDA